MNLRRLRLEMLFSGFRLSIKEGDGVCVVALPRPRRLLLVQTVGRHNALSRAPAIGMMPRFGH